MKKLIYLLSVILMIFIHGCGSENNSTSATKTYTLSLQATPGEAGSVSGGGEYEKAESASIDATANQGWQFDHWEGDYEGNSNSATISMDADKDISAVFKKKDYPLTVNTEGEGSVDEQKVHPKSTDYESGTEVKLTAKPDGGWTFKQWKGDLSGSEATKQITVDSPKEVTAVFEEIEYALTVNTDGQGSVTKSPDQPTYTDGTTVTLTAEPDNGWTLDQWEEDLSGNELSKDITMDADKTVSAVFEEKENLFYLADNGITIKCPEADYKDTGTVNGVTYTKRKGANTSYKNAETTCTSGISNMNRMFKSVSFNGDISHWDVSNVFTMEAMFVGTRDFNQDLGYWDVSNVRHMNKMFAATDSFNGDISSWNVSSVTDMIEMFRGAEKFNGNINGWNVSNVTTMREMFRDNKAFNSNINSWNVGSVTDMGHMFYNSEAFNQDLNNWDVSSVTDMERMFMKNNSFSGDISNWNVSSVTDMSEMFRDAEKFNSDLSSWDVGKVEDFFRMFNHAEVFESNLNNWDMSSAKSIDGMFAFAKSFNSDLDKWDVVNLTSMEKVFKFATSFNGDISTWDVSNVINMESMFEIANSFNRNIGGWDVSEVMRMDAMFFGASDFNQNISGWCVSNFSSSPYGQPNIFATASSLTEEHRPEWGRCPAQ